MGEIVVSSEDVEEMKIEEKAEDGGGGVAERIKRKQGSSLRMAELAKFLPRMALRVMLVEADDSTRQIISALLRKCSYRVFSVPDGLKAWEILKDKAHNFDLILTEVDLPSISGFSLLMLIMEHDICKNIPVISMIRRPISIERNSAAPLFCWNPVDFDNRNSSEGWKRLRVWKLIWYQLLLLLKVEFRTLVMMLAAFVSRIFVKASLRQYVNGRLIRYFLVKLKKVKKSNEQVLVINELEENISTSDNCNQEEEELEEAERNRQETSRTVERGVDLKDLKRSEQKVQVQVLVQQPIFLNRTFSILFGYIFYVGDK